MLDWNPTKDEDQDQSHTTPQQKFNSDTQIRALAARLTQLRRERAEFADQKSWDMATTYVSAFQQIEETIRHETGKTPTTYEVNRRLRAVPGYEGPGASWLSNAKRTEEIFPEVFTAGSKNLPYDGYMQIAVCSLPKRAKHELRTWAERTQPKRAELRQRIRALVDQQPRPDFDLKVTNLWRFERKADDLAEFDGGIHPDLVANLIYYFSDPGDTLLDPMAGGDTTHKVLQKFEFFHAAHPDLDYSGPRTLIRADLNPIHPHILRADVREIERVIEHNSIDLCILDPPYWKIAEGKYEIFGNTITEWRNNIGQAIRAIAKTLKSSGALAIIVDDYLRSKNHHPLAIYVGIEAERAGLVPRATIYDVHPHAVCSMDAKQMWRAKRSRLLVNECKVIQVFEKTAPHA